MASGLGDTSLIIIGLGQRFGDLPPSYKREIERADVLVGGRRQLTPFEYVRCSRIVITAPISRIVEKIEDLVEKGKRVVVLCDGDPLFFGFGRSLVQRFSISRVKILPNVSVAQRAGASLGISSREMEVVSLHGRKDIFSLLDAISRGKWTGVYTDRTYPPSCVAHLLLKRHIQGFKVHIFESIGTEQESYFVGKLSDVSHREFSDLNFMILERISSPSISPYLGMEDSVFVSDGGQITKREIRIMCVSALSPLENKIVWDLGAGCGSVSMEILSIARGCRVYAVERDPVRVEMIYKNRDRFCLYAIEIIQGDIADVIPNLVPPDRIFIGGGISGTGGRDSLNKAWEMLKPGGKVVVSTVLLETMQMCMRFCKEKNISFDIVSVHVDRGSSLGKGIRFVPLNPVTILTLKKD